MRLQICTTMIALTSKMLDEIGIKQEGLDLSSMFFNVNPWWIKNIIDLTASDLVIKC